MSNALSHGCMVPKNSAFPWDCPSTTKAKAHGRPKALSRCRDRDPTPKPKLLNSCGLRPGHQNWVIPPSRVKRCMRSSSSEVTEGKEALRARPSPAETTRTLMELCSEGTLCTLTQSGWPFGFAVEFAVDVEGTPVLCLDPSSLHSQHAVSHPQCTLHVQLNQNGFKQLQCSVIGSLSKPDDRILKQRLHSIWKRQFVEETNEDYLYTIVIEKVFQSHGFSQNGFWVDVADYKAAIADPLCPQEAKIIKDMNDRYSEDIHRISRIYVDLNVEEASRVTSPKNMHKFLGGLWHYRPCLCCKLKLGAHGPCECCLRSGSVHIPVTGNDGSTLLGIVFGFVLVLLLSYHTDAMIICLYYYRGAM